MSPELLIPWLRNTFFLAPVLTGTVCILSAVGLLQHVLAKKTKEQKERSPTVRRYLIGQDDEMIPALDWTGLECFAHIHEPSLGST